MKKVNELGVEYIMSAEQIRVKLDKLRHLQGKVPIREQRNLEERISVLEAQYHYLLRTATYLENYYEVNPQKRGNNRRGSFVEN